MSTRTTEIATPTVLGLCAILVLALVFVHRLHGGVTPVRRRLSGLEDEDARERPQMWHVCSVTPAAVGAEIEKVGWAQVQVRLRRGAGVLRCV